MSGTILDCRLFAYIMVDTSERVAVLYCEGRRCGRFNEKVAKQRECIVHLVLLIGDGFSQQIKRIPTMKNQRSMSRQRVLMQKVTKNSAF